jgi:hypothetical protein
MKLLVRVSVLTLVFAGAVATNFSSKTQAAALVSRNTMVISRAMPIPSCEPGERCAMPIPSCEPGEACAR